MVRTRSGVASEGQVLIASDAAARESTSLSVYRRDASNKAG
ncbi:hypothetical protein ACMFWY_12460 [Roseiconus sp. JC912]